MKVDYTMLRALAARLRGPKGVKQEQILSDLGPVIDANMVKFQIDTPLRKAHFLAQIAHESASFATTREYASGAAYEGRDDLGNTQKGDGRKYRGRGLIQTTGRANVTEFHKWCVAKKLNPPNFVGNPEKIEQMPWALLSAVYYWQSHRLNRYADRDDVITVTKRINGGRNGLQDRIKYLKKAKALLAVSAGDAVSKQQNGILVLRRGSMGEKVEGLQRRLHVHGFAVAIDGDFGAGTETAVRTFQTQRGLTVDGLVGRGTLKALAADPVPIPSPRPHANPGPVISNDNAPKQDRTNGLVTLIVAAVAGIGAGWQWLFGG